MERDRVVELYDDGYAATYDERFLLADWPRVGAEYEVAVLRNLLAGDDPRWLDLGCGTGHVLARFPGIRRAGLDVSAAMLEQARLANPDAEFLREGDFRDDVADWHGAWSVISCMWTAYNYVQSMPEFDRLIANMVRWTRPGGAVFIPVMDLEDLRYLQVGYEEQPDVWGGTIGLTGVTWTWEEAGTGKRHEHLVAPHVEHFVRLLEPHFEQITVVRYPLVAPGHIARKAVVATGRRRPGETGTATVVREPLPDGALDPDRFGGTAPHASSEDPASVAQQMATMRAQIDDVQSKLTEVLDRLARPHAPGATDEGRYDIVGVTHDQVGGMRRELAELSDRLFGPGAPPSEAPSFGRRAVAKAGRAAERVARRVRR